MLEDIWKLINFVNCSHKALEAFKLSTQVWLTHYNLNSSKLVSEINWSHVEGWFSFDLVSGSSITLENYILGMLYSYNDLNAMVSWILLCCIHFEQGMSYLTPKKEFCSRTLEFLVFTQLRWVSKRCLIPLGNQLVAPGQGDNKWNFNLKVYASCPVMINFSKLF